MGWSDFFEDLWELLGRDARRDQEPGRVIGGTVQAGIDTLVETAPQVHSYHEALAQMKVMAELRDFKQLWAEVRKDGSFIVVENEQLEEGEYHLVYAAFLDEQLLPQAPRETHTRAMRWLRIYLRGRFEPRHLAFTMDLRDRSVRGEIYADSHWRREVPELLWEATAFKHLP